MTQDPNTLCVHYTDSLSQLGLRKTSLMAFNLEREANGPEAIFLSKGREGGTPNKLSVVPSSAERRSEFLPNTVYR